MRFPAMPRGSSLLSYAVRPAVVLRLTGLLCWSLMVLPAAPLIIALVNGDHAFAARMAFILSALGLTGFAGRRIKAGAPRLNEVMVVAAMAFVLPPLFMGWALTVFGFQPMQAVFEAVSGVTTTGLTVLGAEEALRPTTLFTRAWMQWVGGFGFAVLALGLMGGAGVSAARRLGEAERVAEDPMGSLRTRARRTLLVYAALTAACFLALLIAGPGAWEALLLSLTALATGGFGYDSASAAALDDWAARYILMGFSLAGAVSFSVYLHLLRRRAPERMLSVDVAGLAGFILAAVAGLALFMALDGFSPGEIVSHASFIAASAQTNTGYSTMSVSDLPAAGLVWLMVAMAIGGNSGSTAGGLKTFRVLTAFAVIRLTLQRPGLARDAVTSLRVGGHRIERPELESIATVVGLAGATVLFAWLPFLAAGYGLDSLFDVVSAVTTTGLSTGVVGPDLAPGLMAVLCVAMVLGRVEFIALLVLLWPPTWFGQRFQS